MSTDVFIDCSRVDAGFDVRAAVERLQRPEYLGAIARRVSCVVESELVAGGVQPARRWNIGATRAVEACELAMAAAAEADQSLLIVLGDVQPSCAAVGMLLEAVETDPMIGFAASRLAGAAEGASHGSIFRVMRRSTSFHGAYSPSYRTPTLSPTLLHAAC